MLLIMLNAFLQGPYEDLLASIACVTDKLGRVVSASAQDSEDLRRYLQVELGYASAPAPDEHIAEVLAAASLMAEDRQKQALHMIAPEEARRRLELLSGPARTLLSLLGPRHMFLKELIKVVLLAEACADWDACLFFVPPLLVALGGDGTLSGLGGGSGPSRRVAVLALHAKACACRWLEQDSIQAQASAGSGLSSYGRDDARLACETALSMLSILHGEFLEAH
eukprot:CAMPEP_0180678074 /NCGR_PEP_ID=MMETSP1037_2-20121125/68189_1 /TAXON_ID=632150 /ORGANISM="Azadinium spinosum, Strain 3D9" /LENGTH=223 /DNA_ID=CAMNT_0022707695 /DNA_START=121 /DNA_END=790 /DNA_ORIENTATION=+